jgi:hypothetical protein
MAAVPIVWREPETFVSGDTLLFQRNLPNYLPSDGWAINLTVTQNTPAGASLAVEAQSTPDATNRYHCFNTANFCDGLDDGIYILSEEVINAAGNPALNIAAGAKHQIYYRDDFTVMADLADGLASGPVLTEAQQMLAALFDSYKQLIKLKFAETEDLRSRFKLQDQQQIRQEIMYWKEMRMNEIQHERVRNGRPPGNVSTGVFCIGA